MLTFPVCKNGLTPLTCVFGEQINNVRHSRGKVFQCTFALQNCSILLLFIILWTHHSQLPSARSCFERWISCTKIIFPEFSLWEGLKCGLGRGIFVREGKGRQAAVIKWVWKGATKEKQLWPKIQTAVLPNFYSDNRHECTSINSPFPTCRYVCNSLVFSRCCLSLLTGTAQVKAGRDVNSPNYCLWILCLM